MPDTLRRRGHLLKPQSKLVWSIGFFCWPTPTERHRAPATQWSLAHVGWIVRPVVIPIVVFEFYRALS